MERREARLENPGPGFAEFLQDFGFLREIAPLVVLDGVGIGRIGKNESGPAVICARKPSTSTFRRRASLTTQPALSAMHSR